MPPTDGPLPADCRAYLDVVTAGLDREVARLQIEDGGADRLVSADEVFEIATVPLRMLLGSEREQYPEAAGRYLASPPPVDLTAVHLHGFHPRLPDGRKSNLYVDMLHLRDGIAQAVEREADRVPDKTIAWDRASATNEELIDFCRLLNYLYTGLYGRDKTFVHSLLELPDVPREAADPEAARDPLAELREKGLVVEVSTDAEAPDGGPDSGRLNVVRVGAGGPLAEQLVSRQVQDQIIVGTADFTRKHLAPGTGGYELDRVEHRLVCGEQLVAQVRGMDVPSDRFKAVREWLDDSVVAVARQAVGTTDGPLWQVRRLLAQTIAFRGAADNHTAALKSAARMLQLLRLYSHHGHHFYFVLPKWEGRPSTFHMCISVASTTRLDPAALAFLQELTDLVFHKLENCYRGLKASPEQDVSEWWMSALGVGLRDQLVNGVLGRACGEPVREPNKKLFYDTYAGVHRYLRLMQTLVAGAVHEGKRLSFTVIIASGTFASQKLEHLSRLYDKGSSAGTKAKAYREARTEWDISDSDNVDNVNAVASLIRGNYAFLQHRGVVLYGDRDGRLLYLSRLLADESPERLTSNRRDCVVVQVVSKGDVLVFSGGRVQLVYSSGLYSRPRRYGSEYVDALGHELGEIYGTGPCRCDLALLARVVWSISERGTGACFVLGQFDSLNRHSLALTRVFGLGEGLPLVSEGLTDYLQSLAEQDGATLIDVGTGRVYGRRQLLGGKGLEERLKAMRADHSELYHWGTRHQSAFAFALGANGDPDNGPMPVTVITVSTDGDIHVFGKDGPIKDLTYPSKDGA